MRKIALLSFDAKGETKSNRGEKGKNKVNDVHTLISSLKKTSHPFVYSDVGRYSGLLDPKISIGATNGHSINGHKYCHRLSCKCQNCILC